MILLGYGYLVAVILGIAGLVALLGFMFTKGSAGALIAIKVLKVVWPLLLIVPLLARALFVRVPKPEGIYLDGAQKQAVVDFIEPVRVAANGPKIHRVVMTPDLNAAVQQIPWFGFFGPNTNYLILGVPLLASMTEDEVKAVVAHEFGHLSKAHGSLGAWSYRLEQSFARAIDAIQQKTGAQSGSWAFRFFHWFYPKFDQLSFSVRRAQEYEADRVAADACGTSVIASALCRTYHAEPTYSAFWEDVWSRARDESSTRNLRPWSQLTGRLTHNFNAEAGQRALTNALQRPTDDSDTHPSLADRLAALGAEPAASLQPPDTSALNAILSSEEPILMKDFDATWQRDAAQNWAAAHEQWEAARSRLKELRTQETPLTRNEELELVNTIESVEGMERARPAYAAMAQRFPDWSVVQWNHARAQYDVDYPAAEAAFVKAVELDLDLAPHAYSWIHGHYEALGQAETAEDVIGALYTQWKEIADQAADERDRLSVDDTYAEHQLSDNRLRALEELFAKHKEIYKVWILRKEVIHRPESPPYLFAFDVDALHNNMNLSEQTWIERILAEIGEQEPEMETFALVLGSNVPQWRQLTDVHAPVYESKRKPSKVKDGFRMVFSILALIVFVAWVVFTLFK